MIQTKTAQKICTHWHGGQWSAFYSFASTGRYYIADHLRYLKEVLENIENEYFAVYPQILGKKDAADLNNLKEYFVNEGRKYGIVTLFSKHTLYGYTVPHLSENTDSAICATVTPIKQAI